MQSKKSQILLSAALAVFSNLVWAQDQNLLPKYGPTPKSDVLKAADAVFIKAMDDEYRGDRVKASSDMASRGWQYLSQRDLDDAMRRFNQAWLLDNKDGIAIWGMAAVQSSRGQTDESLRLFAEAENLVGVNANFSIDHAKAVGMAGVKGHDDALLDDAYKRFGRIYEAAPQNALNLQNWAITLFGAGRYADAWAKVKLAESLPAKGNLDPRFIAALQARMPRPQD